MAQASKMEPSGHNGCGFRHVSASLRTWIFWTVSNSRIPPAILKRVICYQLLAATLWSWGLPLSLCDQSLFNKHPYFLPAPILVLDKQFVQFCSFCLDEPPLLCSPVEHNSSASRISVSLAIVLNLARTKLSSTPYHRLFSDYLHWH